jgi:tetratricopeptide (TPR) repeat protein
VRACAVAGILLLPAPWAQLHAQVPVADRIEAARTAARENRNADAARLFGEALAVAPERRRELLLEYAEQLTWSGRAADAVPLFGEVLGWASAAAERRARLGLALALSWSDRLPEARREYERLLERDPEDREARLGRGRLLSWTGRLGAAREEYERVLAADPQNLEARRSLAQVQSWRGRHTDALDRLEAVLREAPDDAESLLILAQVHDARGRSDLASHTVERLLSLRPDHARALAFRRQLARASRPATRVELQRSTQTDELTITRLSLAQVAPLSGGRTTVELRYQQFGYDPVEALPQVDVRRPGLFLRQRLGDRIELNAGASLDVIEPSAARARSTPLTWDAWLALWPADGVRVDVSSARATFDNIRSLTTPVVATSFGSSVELTPDELIRVSGRASLGVFSDGNRRLFGQAELERRVWSSPNVLVGARATALRFHERLESGYFNPDRYASAAVTGRAWHGWRQRTWVNIGTSIGRESSSPGGARPAWSADARLNHWLTERLELEARYDHFSSRQFFAVDQPTGGGWARRTASMAVRVIW